VGQRRLAVELTTLVHGAAETAAVEAASAALFGRGQLDDLDAGTLGSALAETPTLEVSAGETPTVAELLAGTGLCASRSEARRAVSQGGAYLNNERLDDPDAAPPEDAWLHGRYLVLRRGKRAVAGVRRAA
jgi:tyrosyl-tRNA synthetase